MTKNYEEMVKELREIVRMIDDNNTNLDESIALYERGTVLVKVCEEILAKAELKITELSLE